MWRLGNRLFFEMHCFKGYDHRKMIFYLFKREEFLQYFILQWCSVDQVKALISNMQIFKACHYQSPLSDFQRSGQYSLFIPWNSKDDLIKILESSKTNTDRLRRCIWPWLIPSKHTQNRLKGAKNAQLLLKMVKIWSIYPSNEVN